MLFRPIPLGRSLALALSLALMPLGPSLGAQEIDVGEGETLYQMHCAVCHQATGAGIPAAFPPLAGQIHQLVAADLGRSYPILVTLYGLQGAILVDGQPYDGLMPSMAYLTDEQIADVLNYIMTAWGDAEALEEPFEPYTPEEVAEERDQALLPTEVHVIRAALDLE